MRTIAISALLAGASMLAIAQPPMPRPAPEINIVETSGKSTPLSAYKGKVVVLALIQTTCPHCQHECEVLSPFYADMKMKGQPVQVLAIAFNDNAQALVPAFVTEHHVNFPVGFAATPTVLSFLGFSVMERFNVPQMAVIDKKGMIRAQSGPLGDANLQDINKLKELVASLVAEGAPASTSKTGAKTPAKSASAPAKGAADTKPIPKGSTN